MFSFLKAVVLGAFLTVIVCLFVGSSGSADGFLNVHSFVVEGVRLYWSWPLFLCGTGLAFGIMLLME